MRLVDHDHGFGLMIKILGAITSALFGALIGLIKSDAAKAEQLKNMKEEFDSVVKAYRAASAVSNDSSKRRGMLDAFRKKDDNQ